MSLLVTHAPIRGYAHSTLYKWAILWLSRIKLNDVGVETKYNLSYPNFVESTIGFPKGADTLCKISLMNAVHNFLLFPTPLMRLNAIMNTAIKYTLVAFNIVIQIYNRSSLMSGV